MVKKLTVTLLVLLAILIAGNCSAAHLSKPGGSNQNSQVRLRTPNNQNGSRVRTGSIIEPVATYNVAKLDERAEMAKIGQMRATGTKVLVLDPISGWAFQYSVPSIEDGAELGKTFYLPGFIVVAIGDKARATVLHGSLQINEQMKSHGQNGWFYQLDKMSKEDISRRIMEAIQAFVTEQEKDEGIFIFEASRVYSQNSSGTPVRNTTAISQSKRMSTSNDLRDGLETVATVADFIKMIK